MQAKLSSTYSTIFLLAAPITHLFVFISCLRSSRSKRSLIACLLASIAP